MLDKLKGYITVDRMAIIRCVAIALVLAAVFFAGWKACQRFGANIVEKETTKVVTEIKEVKVPVASEAKTEVQYVEKESPHDADVQIATQKPQVVVDYNGQQTKFATLDNETQKFENGKLKVEQESKTVLDVTPIVEREVQTAVEQNTAKMDEQKNKEIAGVKKEETKKRHKTNLGSFLAGVAGGLILHAYF